MEAQKLLDCIRLQLSEVEMLSSMYPERKEFFVTDPGVVFDMENYLNGKAEVLPAQLQYSFIIELPGSKATLETIVNIHHDYPNVKPIVHARFSTAVCCQQKELNSTLSKFIEDQDIGELCMCSVFSWLTSNASQYCFVDSVKIKSSPSISREGDVIREKYLRIWIYSHHIYNKDKRRNIVDLGKNYKLTGFSMPGKPGVICGEGCAEDCNSFLQDVKQMNWKKLSLLKEECFELKNEDVTSWRKFDLFQEVAFQVRQGPAREYHMDMKEFQKFLESHNCPSIFQDIFGLKT